MSPGEALSRPVLLSDGRCLRTLADVGNLVLSLKPEEQAQPRWKSLVDVLIAEIRSGQPDDLPVVTSQIERALIEAPFGSVHLAAAGPAQPSIEPASYYGTVSSSEFLSILAVGLLAGM